MEDVLGVYARTYDPRQSGRDDGLRTREGLRLGRPGARDHHTPKHGSWLNIAEIELSCLTKQCLGRRIPDLELLNTELTAWAAAINGAKRQGDWRFTTSDAHIKLRRLYPAT